MNITPKFSLVSVLVVAFALPVPTFAQGDKASSIGIVILDDQLDPGLSREGIKPLQATDLDPVVDAAINSHLKVLVRHLPIMWDAKEAPVAALEFTPFPEGQKPTPKSGNLAYREKLKAASQYQKELQLWETKFRAFAETARGEGRAFGDSVIANQLSVTEAHDRLLIENNGREKAGLDLVGAITHANLLLAECDVRILIINSPCMDRSVVEGKRTEPLKPTELDPGIQLVFVNTSRRPQQTMLFKGLPNPVTAHGSLARALAVQAENLAKNK